MKKLLVVLIVLSMMGVFSTPGWAQPEEEDPIQVREIGTTTRIEAEKLQEQIEGAQDQAATVGVAALQTSGCKVESITVGKGEVGVETKCLTVEGVQTLLRMKGREGVVGVYDDGSGSGPVEFKSMEIGKQAAVDVQYNSAVKLVAQTFQAVAVARGTRSFGIKERGEKCNQFTTEQGVIYKFKVRAGLSKTNQPIILGYEITRFDTDKDAVDRDTVTIDVSVDSEYRDVLRGILPVINAGGCPLTEWVELSP